MKTKRQPITEYESWGGDGIVEIMTNRGKYSFLDDIGPNVMFEELKNIKALPKLIPDFKESDMHEHFVREGNRIYHTYYFSKAGKRIFSLSEALAQKLMHTDVSKVDSALVRMPFKSIYLRMPEKLVWSNLLNKFLRGIFIKEIEDVDGNGRSINIMACYEGHWIQTVILKLQDGDIGDQYAQTTKDFLEQGVYERESYEKYEPDTTRIMHLTIATLLYISSEKSDKETIAPRVMAKNQDSRYPSCHLGGSIVLQKEFGKKLILTRSKDIHEINVLKWSVRGHFRNQKVGPGRTGVKIIFIEPFLKGQERENENVPERVKQYEVK